MDEYLLEKDLSRFLEPWRYGRLNTLERLLLARRLPAQQAAEVRALQDLLAMTPVNREEDRRRLETALQGFSLARSAGGAGGMGGGGEGKDRGELGDAKSKLAMLGGRMAARQLAAFDKEASAPEAAGQELDQLSVAVNEPFGTAKPMMADDSLALRDEPLSRFGTPVTRDADAKEDFGFNGRFNEDFLTRGRGVNEVFFRALGVTQEWAENNYWKLLMAQQDASLVMPNRFWLDFAQWSGQGSFVSAHVAEAARTFSEMMLALAVLDLPFPSQAAEIKAVVSPEAVLTLTPSTPLIVFHQSVKPAPVDEAGAGLLVSQNFYRADDRYIPQPDGEKIDKFVTGEFLAGVRYGAQVVVTNPTHFAVALKYERGRDKAPMVLAKGERAFAMRIKALAAEHGVPMVENKPVARMLFKVGKVGKPIPLGLYQAVADILAFVYKTHRYYFHRLKERRSAA